MPKFDKAKNVLTNNFDNCSGNEQTFFATSTGTVVKIIGAIFEVYVDDKVVTCDVRNTIKKSGVCVGDKVEIIANEYDLGKYIIVKVQSRKNLLLRPPLANIDKLLILISPLPSPDLYLVDKLIIYCQTNAIEPIIVINKSDIATQEFVSDIASQYYFAKVFVISSLKQTNISHLKQSLVGHISALCGQSAVGKSSLINALIPHLDIKTNELSARIDRGKHTTRVNQIHIHDRLMIADTPGFSSLDLSIEHDELAGHYPEFVEIPDCKYLNCSHVFEGKDCSVITAVGEGKINAKRYDRYAKLYKDLKKAWEIKYD